MVPAVCLSLRLPLMRKWGPFLFLLVAMVPVHGGTAREYQRSSSPSASLPRTRRVPAAAKPAKGRRADPAFDEGDSMSEDSTGGLLGFAGNEAVGGLNEAPKIDLTGKEGTIGRVSMPKPWKRADDSSEGSFSGEATAATGVGRGSGLGSEERLEAQNLFGSLSKKVRRLATAGSKCNVTSLQLPVAGSRSSQFVTAMPEPPRISELTKLNRQLRKEAERFRPVDETYPDIEAEKNRRRLVRRAMVNLYNLQSVKRWQKEQDQIAAQKQDALMGGPGLKSLGWKGDERFKNPEERPEEVKKQKPRRKRKPYDECIRQLNEMMRDPEIIRKINNTPPTPIFKSIGRVCKKWARRRARENAQAFDEGGDKREAVQESDSEGGGAVRAEMDSQDEDAGEQKVDAAEIRRAAAEARRSAKDQEASLMEESEGGGEEGVGSNGSEETTGSQEGEESGSELGESASEADSEVMAPSQPKSSNFRRSKKKSAGASLRTGRLT